jgi:hypothetical protein
MEPRHLIDNGSYGPDQLKVLFKAFDDAWDGIAGNFDSPLAIQAARLKLANIVLSMARNGINDPEQIKCTALQIMAPSDRL